MKLCSLCIHLTNKGQYLFGFLVLFLLYNPLVLLCLIIALTNEHDLLEVTHALIAPTIVTFLI